MTGNRGRSRLQIWVAVPVPGLVAGAGLAALTAQGLDGARNDRSADRPSSVDATDDGDGDEEDPVAAALRVRSTDTERPTLLRPAAAVSPALPEPATSPMVTTVLSSPVWSGVGDATYIPPAVSPPPPPLVVVATPPAPASPPVVVPPPVVTPPVESEQPGPVQPGPVEPGPEEPTGETPTGEEPGYGTEEPPAEEPTDPPVDPPSDPVDETAIEQTPAPGTESMPPGPSVETVG